MSDTPEFMTHERIMTGEEYVSYSDYLLLQRERDEAREELHKANVEANALATSIQKAEYSDAKEFELLESVAGVISQIDNMNAGVRKQRDEWRKKFELSVDAVEIAARLARAESERDDARREILGWENKWKAAVEMAALAENERDRLREKLTNTEDQLDFALICIRKFEGQSTESEP